MRPGSDRLPLVVVGLGLCLLPLLNPKGPANMAPVDLVLGAAILVVAIWASTVRARVRVPYAIAFGGLALTGLVAALAGDAPITGASAVVQEVFLLAWCVAVTMVCRTPQGLRTVTRTWCLSSTVWAVIVVLAVMAGVERVPGGSGGEGVRARLWFDHPNMASNYFMIAFFVVIATRQPRKPLARAFAVTALLAALLLAGSNSAISCLPIGLLVIVFLRIQGRRGPIPALAASLCLVLVAGILWAGMGQPILARIQSSDAAIVRSSVGRGEKSTNSRAELFASEFNIFREGHLLGIGPAASARALVERRAHIANGSHNDYLATLVERGPLGMVALMSLMGAIGVRLVSAQKLSPEWASVVPNPAALAAAAVGFAVSAVTHEVLHYRNLWTLLAIIAALHLYGRSPAGSPSSSVALGATPPSREAET